MLSIDVPRGESTDRSYAHFWNHTHSIETALDGVRLALWMDRASVLPEDSDSESVIVVEFGNSSVQPFLANRRRLNKQALETLDWKAVICVALARFELFEQHAWVAQLLMTKMSYSATLPTQVSGWWTDETKRPSYRETGALLPENARLADGAQCLVLVDLDDWWGVLSQLGLGTYTFGSRLEAGEVITFLDTEERRWAVQRERDVELSELTRRWGPLAADRARGDSPLLVVRVKSLH